MKNTLIIQFRVSDFDDPLGSLIEIENMLIQAFAQNGYAVVDGHDFGQDQMNIFIHPKGAWGSVIERVNVFLQHRGVLQRATIAKRPKSGRAKVIWPEDHDGNFDL